MILYPLECHRSSAAANMAIDCGMLKHAQERNAACLRFYAWSRPACSFGYSQPHAAALAQLSMLEAVPDNGELIRRPSGGGFVDHRRSYTYALALPASHWAQRAAAPENYCRLHRALQSAFARAAVPTQLATGDHATGTGFSICFQAPVEADLLQPDTTAKLAGAAVRRSRDGLLFQGSIQPVLGTDELPPDAFQADSAAAIAEVFGLSLAAETTPVPPPDPALQVRFESSSWNRRR